MIMIVRNGYVSAHRVECRNCEVLDGTFLRLVRQDVIYSRCADFHLEDEIHANVPDIVCAKNRSIKMTSHTSLDTLANKIFKTSINEKFYTNSTVPSGSERAPTEQEEKKRADNHAAYCCAYMHLARKLFLTHCLSPDVFPLSLETCLLFDVPLFDKGEPRFE